jgi:hypothetical protein
VARALALVRQGGHEGLSFDVFASKWPSKLKKGVARKSTAPVGQFLGYLAGEGLLARDVLGLYTLTAKGSLALYEFEAELERARAASARDCAEKTR